MNINATTFSNGRKMADTSIIHAIEQKIGHSFPSEYVDVVSQHDGASIKPFKIDAFDTYRQRQEEFLCNDLLAFHDGSMAWATSGEVEGLPLDIVPFADDAGGWLICFDYRNVEIIGEPSIVVFIQDHPEGHRIQVIASSFSDLIARLR